MTKLENPQGVDPRLYSKEITPAEASASMDISCFTHFRVFLSHTIEIHGAGSIIKFETAQELLDFITPRIKEAATALKLKLN